MVVIGSTNKLSKLLSTKCTSLNKIFVRHDVSGLKLEYTDLVRMGTSLSRQRDLPGPYPKTLEDYKNASKRYGLHLYEYKPFPQDCPIYTGDYPDLPLLSVESRCPHYPWDFPAERRNFNEFMHKDYDILGRDRLDFGVRTYFDNFWGAMSFYAFMAFMFAVYAITPDMSQPVMKKQYPGKGVHYSFELK